MPAAIVVNAINESQIEQIEVFPNPTINTVKFKGDIQNLDIYITNSLGQKLEVAIDNKKIDIAAFERGVCFVVVSNKEGKKTFSVVKL
ncbi:MAG: T9SS type A sorting domain-containing protein [Chitinophagales bacterium]|nr:T9SS type A sorting domain-containing protein [Chitinophagales bacterium]